MAGFTEFGFRFANGMDFFIQSETGFTINAKADSTSRRIELKVAVVYLHEPVEVASKSRR